MRQRQPPDFTRRQLDVLRLAAAGYTNRQIATHLHLSLTTVNHHVVQACRRTGAHTRTHAVALAIFAGHIDPRHVTTTRQPGSSSP